MLAVAGIGVIPVHRMHVHCVGQAQHSMVQSRDGRTYKHKFTPEEDERLKQLVSVHGTSSWNLVSRLMGTRNHRQCRERWKNYLDPRLRKDAWTLEEDALLAQKVSEIGPRWNEISKAFVDRSDNSIRNRWHMLTRRASSTKLRGNHRRIPSRNSQPESSPYSISAQLVDAIRTAKPT
jgi:hypothetical protein